MDGLTIVSFNNRQGLAFRLQHAADPYLVLHCLQEIAVLMDESGSLESRKVTLTISFRNRAKRRTVAFFFLTISFVIEEVNELLASKLVCSGTRRRECARLLASLCPG